MSVTSIPQAPVRHVDQDYRHHDKIVTPRGLFEAGAARLKWYDIAVPERPVAPSVRALAERTLKAQSEQPDWDLSGDLGFVMLHRCGRDFYFLITCSWRGNNELWETVLYKQSDATPAFSLFPREGSHKGTYCVWEMGVVWHETRAWAEFLRSRRDDRAIARYLDTQYSGAV